MGRRKRGKPWKKSEHDQEEEEYDEPDPNSVDFIYDNVDKYHAEREKILLEKVVYAKGRKVFSDENNFQNVDVMALDIADSSDEDEEDEENNDEEEEEKEEFDEKEDTSENEDNTGIPDTKWWGKEKSAFYSGDVVEEYGDSDEEMDELAQEEEQEALALQKQMAASLEEQDFDADILELPHLSKKKGKEDELEKEKIVQDLSKLSKEEKIEILMRDSPELFQLMDEFKSKLKEVTERLHPLVKLARAGQISEEGASYLELKHQLYLNYCVNIGFYLLLKAKKMSVKDHPVMARLVQYQKLITELKPLDEKLKSEEKLLLTQSQIPEQNGSLEESMLPRVPTKKASKRPTKTGKSASCLLDDEGKVLEGDSAVGKGLKVKKVKVKHEKKASRKRQAEEDRGLMGPVEDNGAVKLAKGKKKEAEQAAERATEEQPLDEEKDETEEGKRAITNQMSQNKIFKARKKKKECSNPRVKHRKKYYKAKIKHKSRVLPVMNEQYRYGGEMTGIKSNLTRSVKIR